MLIDLSILIRQLVCDETDCDRERERGGEGQRKRREQQISHARFGMRKASSDEAQNELWKRGGGCPG